MPITPDDKNWTWVLDRECPECGFDGSTIDAADVGRLLRETAAEWPTLVGHPLVTQRPSDDRWSALEYACHVSDVIDLYHLRLDLMLAEDSVRFANWDQDESAITLRYSEQDPTEVAAGIVAASNALANRFETVTGDDWSRRGIRSDGAEFTIATFARYFLHDPIHHVDDVRRGYAALERQS